MTYGPENAYLFSRKVDSENMLYELIMQFSETIGNEPMTDVIMQWKELQAQNAVDKQIISEDFAKEQLVLIREIISSAEKSLIKILLWDNVSQKKTNHLIPLTTENKDLLQIAIKQISILCLYRNDWDIDKTKLQLHNLINKNDTSNIILHIELSSDFTRIKTIFFTKEEN